MAKRLAKARKSTKAPKPFPAAKLSLQDYSIVKFSKIIKKITKDFDARDMVRYLNWIKNKEHHTK